MKRYFLILIACFFSVVALAQGERKDRTAVTYEEIYDEPYSVRKLFVHFQPFYGEMFVTNVNAGFGVEASYYLDDKADFKAHFRKSYSAKFFDQARDLATKNSSFANEPGVFNYFELGGTYHIRDFEQSSKTKMFMYKKSYKGNRWAARVPLHAEIPCKVRKIYGARVGGIVWDSSTDLGRAIEKQGLTNEDFLDDEGNPMPEGLTSFTNVSSAGGYVGGSITWIKNIAVDFDKFEEGIDDLIFTIYLDILFSPAVSIDDLVYINPDTQEQFVYDMSPVKTKSIGVRAGLEGKFNRNLSWAYGGEVGYRPSLEGRGFYALLKISFPVFGTNLDYKVESFGK